MRTFMLIVAVLSVYFQTSSQYSACNFPHKPVFRTKLINHPKWYLLDHENCGDSSSDRIIGGKVAEMGEFPWLARLGYVDGKKAIYSYHIKPRFKCGGSLINHMYVLTAAHCVTQLGGDQLVSVRLGEYDVKNKTDCDQSGCAPAPQDFEPTKVIVHQRYSEVAFTNDIALIRLDRPAVYNLFVSPICLPYGKLMKNSHLPTIYTVAGWGIKDIVTREVSNVPLFVELSLVRMQECLKRLEIPSLGLGKGQLCVGGEKGYDSCSGDSGGALMAAATIYGPPKFYQIGIVSFGSTECGGSEPAIYTDVRYYMLWILDHIEP